MKADLSLLSLAVKAAGGSCFLTEKLTAITFLIPSDAGTRVEEWDGESEDGRVAFFLRDLVRRFAPGSFAFPWNHPEDGACVVYTRTAEGYDVAGLTTGPAFAANETQCWALALVALYSGGMLPGGAANANS